MRERLLSFLACPECRHPVLDLTVFERRGDEIESGMLRCAACIRQFPLIAGVPRLLPDSLIGTVQRYHPEFFTAHTVAFAGTAQRGAVASTLAFFTRQRPELFATQIDPAFATYLRHNLELRIPEMESFAGQFGLDAGCGEGRYTQCMADGGAEVVGLDLGNSVDFAYRRNQGNSRVHIVQGSIYQPPFRLGVFDFITSIGVLHHLPDPRRGFEALVPLLATGGTIHIWVYGLEDMSFVYRVSHLTPLRGLTSHLPPGASYVVSIPITLVLEAGIFLPVRLAHRLGVNGHYLPEQLLEVASLPFSAKVAEVHDRIGAPVTHFLSGDEVRDWYSGVGLEEIGVTITPGGRGWTGRGRSPRAASPPATPVASA